MTLLQDTQAYLACLARRQAPGERLVRAWEQFYQAYGPLLVRYATVCRVPRACRDDCVQQVWAELVRKLPGFRYDPGRGRFRSWVFTLVHSKAVDLLRQLDSHPIASLPAGADTAVHGPDWDPAAAYERRRRREAVVRVLAELRGQVSERNYHVLHLRWLEGLTVREVADRLGMTVGQVWLREHRMKQKFRRLFNRHAGKDDSFLEK